MTMVMTIYYLFPLSPFISHTRYNNINKERKIVILFFRFEILSLSQENKPLVVLINKLN